MAEPGEAVTVSLGLDGGKWGDDSTVTADAQGSWAVMLDKKQPGAGKALTLTITGSKTAKPIVISDVVFGEVWVASGQSNMAMMVAESLNAKQEIADSANDQVRMWTAGNTVASEPAFTVKGTWAVASPQTTGRFSAAAYYFAIHLQKELGVPVGILHASWGGTPIEAWTSRQKLDGIDWAGPILERYDLSVKNYEQTKAEYLKALKLWEQTRNGPENTGFKDGMAKPDFDDSGWKTMTLPQTWEAGGLGQKDGVVWFRKKVTLPDGWAQQKLKLELGPIDDGDTTYINNEKVGETAPSANNAWQKPRVYNVPDKLVKAGEMTIVVRVVDLAGGGGIWGKPEQLMLSRADGQGQAISLAGDWKYSLVHEIDATNRPARAPSQPFGPEHPHSPAGLFNGMIAPIVPYTIQGVIWYQGESNSPRALQYRKLFPGMIEDWRTRWGQGDFPFLFVQLANYRNPTDEVVDTDWAHLRDAQLRTLGTVKNTGMAVTIDIGDAKDIHPKNKQDVGGRLARWALADTYGRNVVKSGPIYKEHKIQNSEVLVWFTNFGSSMKTPADKPLLGFTVAGKDGVFYPAKAQVTPFEPGSSNPAVSWSVVVSSDAVKEPVAVRYAWEDNPDEANLFNEEGLPASPFRTDDWAGPTDTRR